MISHCELWWNAVHQIVAETRRKRPFGLRRLSFKGEGCERI
jgi:hypothetical protein